MSDIYKITLALLVDAALRRESPFSCEELLLHLNTEAGRWYGNAQMLRHKALAMPRDLRELAEQEAAAFNAYSEQCSTESTRLLNSMTPAEIRAMRERYDAPPDAALPFVEEN